MGKSNVETVRVNMNLSKALMEQVKEYAEEMGITNTAAISVLVNTALNERKAVDGIQKFMEIYEAEKAKVSA